jgi:formylglycine-generating enzyme required for sulfatase activity
LVTNAEFREFVDATGYKTIAERPIDWEEMKKNLPPGTRGHPMSCSARIARLYALHGTG